MRNVYWHIVNMFMFADYMNMCESKATLKGKCHAQDEHVGNKMHATTNHVKSLLITYYTRVKPVNVCTDQLPPSNCCYNDWQVLLMVNQNLAS